MRVLVDTDVVLDVIIARTPFATVGSRLLDLAEQGVFEAYVSALTPLNVFYIARKAKSSTDLRQAVRDLLGTVKVCPLDYSVLTAAFSLPFSDYEDAVQHCCATASNLDAIVTRNVADYKNATLPVFSPIDFLNHLESSKS